MTIDKAIKYPVRKKYRGGGYDAGAGGGTASGYGGGAFGGSNTSGGNGGNNNNNYNSISSYTAGATQAQLDSIQKGIADKKQAAADKVAADNLAINTGLTSLYGLGEGFDLSGYDIDETTTSLTDINAAMTDLNKRKKSVADRIKESTLNVFNNPMETATNLTLGGLSNAYKGLSLNPKFAGVKLLGNFFNTNYTQDEDGNISSSLTGALGLPDHTTLRGLASAKNLIGYDTMTEAEQEAAQQDILKNFVNFDSDGNFLGTDFSAIQKDTSLYNPGSDLEANAKAAALANRGQKRDSADGLSTENVGGGSGGGSGGGTGGGGTGGDTGDDDSTTNNKTYTAEQERTMAYLGEMGYNRRYQEDYIDKDGVLFNFDEYDDIDFVS